MLNRTGALALAALAILTLSVPARAESVAAPDASVEEARAHIQKAKVHYDLGEFQQAAEEYILVYRLKPIPAVLYNVAQAYRRAGMYDKAKQFYRTYLLENPDKKTQAVIEKAIHDLDELLAKERGTREAGPNGLNPAPPAVDRPPAKQGPTAQAATPVVSKPIPAPGAKPSAPRVATIADTAAPARGGGRVLGYVLAGGAVALLGGGAFFSLQAAHADSDLTGGQHQRPDADKLISTSKTDHLLGAVLLGAGVAAGLGAGAVFLFAGSDGNGVGVQGNF